MAHPPSLLAFARASKYCYLHASSFLFRTVKTPICDGKQRFDDVHYLEKRLLRDDAFGHVRRLILHPCTGEPNFHYLSLHKWERGREDDSELWNCWDTFPNPWAFPIASIFEVIDGAKPIPPGRSSPLPLERLELHVTGGHAFPGISLTATSPAPLSQFLCALNQDWEVERDIRDDSREVIRVNAIGWREDWLREEDLENTRNDPYWFGLWRRVWPIEREGVDWWDDWESRPLDLEADVSGRLSDMKL